MAFIDEGLQVFSRVQIAKGFDKGDPAKLGQGGCVIGGGAADSRGGHWRHSGPEKGSE